MAKVDVARMLEMLVQAQARPGYRAANWRALPFVSRSAPVASPRHPAPRDRTHRGTRRGPRACAADARTQRARCRRSRRPRRRLGRSAPAAPTRLRGWPGSAPTSCGRFGNSRTPAGSRRAIRQKPSCLISCSHWPREGSFEVWKARRDEAGREGTLQHVETNRIGQG